MKVSDYIIEFLLEKGVTGMFGYPGGVICHVMDSVTKYGGKITAHTLYHEQSCAFAACAYAQATHNLGVAFATSGPGATNLVTGIAGAFYDSIPVLFLTGNVDTYGVKGDRPIRQRGFQETDFVSIVQSITKYSVFVTSPDDIVYCLEKAYFLAMQGRPGPVVLDLPADIQRAEVDVAAARHFKAEYDNPLPAHALQTLINDLRTAKRPCILAGGGVKQSGNAPRLKQLLEKLGIPLVTSLPAVDLLPSNHKLSGGFIGTNGHRYGNFILSKADLVLTLGTRLDLKQVGNKRDNFAPNAKLYRVDIDSGELSYPVRSNEVPLLMDISDFLKHFETYIGDTRLDTDAWIDLCAKLKEKLKTIDFCTYHHLINKLSGALPQNINITVDTGQSSVWAPQSFEFKDNQHFFVSAGLGSMGYSLPAAIGAYYANKLPVVCFAGDAGIQMNIQELQYIDKEHLPIAVVILNNNSMGMIRQFQEKNFNKNYYLTTADAGYASPDFEKIAGAYNFRYKKITSPNDTVEALFPLTSPLLIDVQFETETYLLPNFNAGKPLDDMDPPLERGLYKELADL
ncbi:acetolactate synthase [Spirochaetia bacterium]|nr:acetolactate synthase [Spirochaetia bacterium]